MAKAKKTVKKKTPAKKAAPQKTLAKKAKPSAKKATKPTFKGAVKGATKKLEKSVKAAAPRKQIAKPIQKTKVSATPKSETLGKAKTNDLTRFVTPLDDRVLVRLNGVERKTAGGLFIPDTVADVSGNVQGRVIAVGRGHRDKKGRVRPMDIQLGDEIVFAQYAGSKINILSEDLVLLREGEVMGILS